MSAKTKDEKLVRSTDESTGDATPDAIANDKKNSKDALKSTESNPANPAKEAEGSSSKPSLQKKSMKTTKEDTTAGNIPSNVVKAGDRIKVHYTGTLDDGTVFDSSEKHNQPLEFEVGGGHVIKGFDNAVLGMKLGEEKQVKLSHNEAYGSVNPQLVRKFPKDKLPPGKEPKAGMVLLMGLPNGAQVPVKITEVGSDDVTIDLNHPLAGKALNFKLKLVEFC